MKKARQFRIPIVLKLVGVTVTLMLIATISIALRSTKKFEEISTPREKDANGTAAESTAAQLNFIFDRYRDKIRIVSSLLFNQYSTEAERDSALRLSFHEEADLISLSIVTLANGKQEEVQYVEKQEFLEELKLTKDYLKKLKSLKPFPTASVFAGNIEIRNSSLPSGAPLLTMGIPVRGAENSVVTHVAIADLRLDGVQKPFTKVTERSFYLVDKEGIVLAHPEDKLVFEGKSFKDFDIVKRALEAKVNMGETRFYDSVQKDNVIASFAKTQYGPIVVAQTLESVILEPARVVRREAFYITGLILSGAIFFVFLFSITLTNPIERLVDVTRLVAGGNFDVQANIKSHDEVGDLARSFDAMVGGLRERDKMKNVLNKFHGSSVADDMIKGDLQLGGTRKEVTIFFSDIRDFTKFSEGHTPEEVVTMLNEYFEIMVDIVTRNHGVVDKFVGDAMMAVWGTPTSTGQDEYYALKSCIEMRQALAELNTLRIGRGQVAIKIGMGLNSGQAISGTIGSSQRMEYTVIGDSVNTAARIEASTKSFGTDLLISGETLEKVKTQFIFEYAGAAEVKGKAEPLKMHKVKGYFDENGQEVLVKTEYSDYAAGHDDKVKIAS